MVKNIILSLFLVVSASLHAQENPKIGREAFSSAPEQRAVKKAIRKGDSYYRDGLYDAAAEQYMLLYAVNGDCAPLNYKIAVSRLYGVHPKNALPYFEQTDPGVASDYYCQKGIALIYHQRYDEAKEAFRRYSEALPAKEAKREEGKIGRFMAICDFSAKAVQDSLPAFVINAGPHVNSYYDDYSAAELASADSLPKLYFTSRRPKDDGADIASHSVFSERILYSDGFAGGKAGDAQETKLTSLKHLSVAGVDNSANALLYYKGKKRFGDVYSTQFKANGKTAKDKRLKKKISRKTTAEGSISIAESGDAYFISDRMGGSGGKDIWYAKKRGKRNYRRPRNISALNTPLNEESVFVSPDGNTLWYSTNGLPGMGGYDVYRSVRGENGVWGEPVNMGYPVNGPDDDMFYRLTSDSTVALLSSKRSGGFGGLDVYFIRKDLRIPFELSGNVTDVKTGRTLPATVKLFDRATDMPVAAAANDTLQQRYTLSMEDVGRYYLQAEAPGYHSVTDSFANPAVRHAKLQHDFTLERMLHPYTLSGYVTDVKTKQPLMAEVVIKAAGKEETLYRTVSDAATGFYTLTVADKENFDLAAKATDYFDLSESLPLKSAEGEAGSRNIALQKSKITYILTGAVTADAGALKANITAVKVGEQTGQTVVTNESGQYEMMLADAGPFLLEATSEGYFFAGGELEFEGDSASAVRNFVLKKMESGAKMVIDNILFNTGKATLMPESYGSLNKLVNLLKENPGVKIEVSGHTDNVGSAASNKTLSKNRALSVRNYLISQGIAGERVQYDGYGFDRPIAPNNTPEGRAANRRVEIEILD